jgi:hypothetical protein
MPWTREKASLWVVLILIALAAAVILLSILGVHSASDAWDTAFGPKTNGSWRAVSLDGHLVGSEDYVIVIKHGKVVGGFDDCNGWSFEDEGPGPNGDRRVMSTLVRCPPKKADQTYHILAYGPRLELLGDRELSLSRAGHVGLFRRCKPDRERRHCVPV